MIIDLASVTQTPRPLTADIDGAQIDLAGEGMLDGVAHFEGELFRDGTKTHIRGTLTAEAELVCTRCAEPTRLRLETPFDDVFVDAAEESTDDEHEIGGSQLDEQLVQGNEVDLTEIIREQILLDLPEQVYCREDCKGLCPHCGANRNLIDCECGEKEIDPRWAALKNLN